MNRLIVALSGTLWIAPLLLPVNIAHGQLEQLIGAQQVLNQEERGAKFRAADRAEVEKAHAAQERASTAKEATIATEAARAQAQAAVKAQEDAKAAQAKAAMAAKVEADLERAATPTPNR